MHIPNIIPLWQCAIYLVIFFVALFFSQRWVKKNLDERSVPLIAVLAAGIFVIMMINIPLPLGISGHVVGAAMIAIIFGAVEPAIIIFALVLLAEALLMNDGGITVIGANLLNMGIIGGFVGLYGFKVLRKPLGKVPAIAIASWGAIFLSAIAVTIELWFAGVFPLNLGLIFMGLFHSVIGIIEAIITVIVILALEKIRPDLLAWTKKDEEDNLKSEANKASRKNRNIIIAGLAIVLIMGLISPFISSSNPDGLEKSLEQLNPNITEQNILGLGYSPFGELLTIVLGILVTLGIAYIIIRLIKRRSPPEIDP